MQDVFIEYLVKRKSTPQTTLAKAGIIAAVILVSLACITFSGFLGPFSTFGLLIAAGAVYGGYYLLTSMNLEYEYAVTNGDLDIDKIVAQRKRRRIVSVNCRQVEAFGRYNADEHANKGYQTKIMACDSPNSQELWYCVIRLKEKGQTLVVFNASEKMLSGIKPFLPRPIMHEAFRA